MRALRPGLKEYLSKLCADISRHENRKFSRFQSYRDIVQRPPLPRPPLPPLPGSDVFHGHGDVVGPDGFGAQFRQAAHVARMVGYARGNFYSGEGGGLRLLFKIEGGCAEIKKLFCQRPADPAGADLRGPGLLRRAQQIGRKSGITARPMPGTAARAAARNLRRREKASRKARL